MISHNWSPMKRLIWLRGSGITGGAGTYETVTGNPVSFTARNAPLRQLEVAFSPVQDLHGYDSPWPAAGGKNKCDGTAYSAYLNSGIPYITPLTPIESPYSIAGNYNGVGFIVPVKAGVTYALSSDATGESQNWYCGVYSSVEDMINRANCLEYASRQSNFTPTHDGFLLFMRYSMVAGTTVTWSYAQAEIGSTPTAFAPYSNLCPILGWDSLNVEQRGKNLLKLSADNAVRYIGKDTFYTAAYGENSFTFKDVSRVAALSAIWQFLPVVTSEMVGQKYTMSATLTDGSLRFVRSASGASWSSAPTELPAGNAMTIAEADVGHAIGVRFYNDTGADQTVSNLQIELGSTASPYQPYNPSSRSISITLGQTVYSGWVDVVTGVGEITHQMVTLVGGESETWGNYNATYGGYRLTLSDAKIDGLPIDQLKSNLFVPNQHRGVMAEWKPYYLVTYNNKADSTMVFFTTSLTDKSEWLAWLAANPTQLVYPLATPLTIQLTPQEVESLAGDNTLWSDANQPITVTYRSN